MSDENKEKNSGKDRKTGEVKVPPRNWLIWTVILVAIPVVIFLRTRTDRRIALVLPALLFATIHFHLPSYLPLAALGIVFSLAYERTGSIGTAIVGHALFNLNNLLVLLAGGGK